MIQLRSVTKKYKNTYALKNINLDIMAGEFVFLTGASGAGKSTLMKLLYREEKPTCGVIMIANSINLADLPDDKVPNLRRCMGIVFQDYIKNWQLCATSWKKFLPKTPAERLFLH